MSVVTRFAPSPTGFLHIGGARTALFNWLYAKHHDGKFLLRIEDTDRARSTPEATKAILDGLEWLGLNWDDDAIYQFAQVDRHVQVAQDLLKAGKAYYCYTSPEELERFRAEHPNTKFRSPWRDKQPDAALEHKPVIRLKAPQEGTLTIEDRVQGVVKLDCSEIDDAILLRSDGTPTYMLAVVVDDHDMGVTQIIRGDDHLTNSFRQLVIYEALGWKAPHFAHIPLIHGPDGAKLSKRHGALGVEAYREMGYLPEALRNYLLRLGWAHGDDEIISTEQAIKWFGLDGCGKSPSRFDFAKLENLNGHYIREAEDTRLAELVVEQLGDIDELAKVRIIKGMAGLKQRAKTIKELAENAKFYASRRPIEMDEKALSILDNEGKNTIQALLPQLNAQEDFTHEATMALVKAYAESKDTKLGKVAQPLRAALSGKTTSPSVFEIMEILGKEESLGRLKDAC
ncbi:MAG: glutamate--tRNA ligase [Rickettsiales bacterium]